MCRAPLDLGVNRSSLFGSDNKRGHRLSRDDVVARQGVGVKKSDQPAMRAPALT
jgi:hypothetical protein